MSNGIEMLSYSNMRQTSDAEIGCFLTSMNEVNFLPFVFILAVLIVLYKGINHFLKRA